MHAIHPRQASTPCRFVLLRRSRVGFCAAALALLPALGFAADPPIKLNGTMTEGGDVSFPIISPDGLTVVYAAGQDTDGRTELYSVPIGGGTSVRLNRPLPAGGTVFSFRLSPDSSTVAYNADQNTDDVIELFSVTRVGAPQPEQILESGCE